jgi:hypothetical protein
MANYHFFYLRQTGFSTFDKPAFSPSTNRLRASGSSGLLALLAWKKLLTEAFD